MELHALRIFAEVVRQNGFSAAANVVNATQSTVSKAVKQLEYELGTPLLNRLSRRVSLTSAGEAVYRGALRILAERDDLLVELSDLQSLKRGTLRLGLPPINTSTLFAPVFTLYRRRYPNVDVTLVELGGEALREQVLSGTVDLAVALLPTGDELEWQEVTSEPLVVVMALEHPLSKCKTITLADLRHQPIILFEVGFSISRLVLDACKRNGIQPNIVARSSQIEFVIELATSGLGVGFLPRLIAVQRGVHYVLLAEPNTKWNLVMIWRRGAYLSNASKAWLDLAHSYHAEHGHIE